VERLCDKTLSILYSSKNVEILEFKSSLKFKIVLNFLSEDLLF